MARINRTIIAGGVALSLALSLGACGGGDTGAGTAASGEPTTDVETAPLSTDAEVTPTLIEPGWLNADNTSDLWYPDGDAGAGEALYFAHAANDAGLDVTFVDAEGNEDGVWDLEIVSDRLVTKADAEGKRRVDIAFQDNFTCYDAESDTFYIRGDRSQDEYDALLEGKSFVDDPANPEDFMVSFEADGVCVQRQSGYDPLEGTWQVVSTNVVTCHYSNGTSEWDTKYRFEIGADDSIAELDDGAPTKLQFFEE